MTIKQQNTVSNDVNDIEDIDGDSFAPSRHKITGTTPACRYPPKNQHTSGRWDKQMTAVVSDCVLRRRKLSGYKVCMINGVKQNYFKKQKLCDQAIAVRKNSWFTDVELKVGIGKQGSEETMKIQFSLINGIT